jgi:uncharacterized protein YcnI
MKKLLLGIATAALTVTALPAIALAHVIVTPARTAVGEGVLFNVSVPNERQVAVSSIMLNVPAGLQDVQPNALAGWDITTTQTSNDDVNSITWTGTIPAGQREDFGFKAQAPAQAGQLDWKAYQTYADGTVVSWDQKPAAGQKDDDPSDVGPYSVTNVVDDLNANPAANTADTSSNKDTLALAFSIAALILSAAGLFLRRRE